MTKLTGTVSEAAAYEFTTLTAVPGITRYNGARLQVRFVYSNALPSCGLLQRLCCHMQSPWQPLCCNSHWEGMC